MSSNDKTWDGSKMKGSAKVFAEYCQAELEYRRNAETDFDEEVYRQAVELVLRKLGVEVLK
ncbi:MAG: hypothetical protein Q9N68_05225 [Gammaproteobacteria bacterium]|nr:hypothetical protein [Gammaproteobacteria bacterium]